MQNILNERSHETEKKKDRSYLIFSVCLLVFAFSNFLEIWQNQQYLFKEVYEQTRANDLEQAKLDKEQYRESNAELRAELNVLEERIKKLEAK